MKEEIIYDGDSSLRFEKGKTMYYIASGEATLSNTINYNLSVALCCSFVKTTTDNLFYSIQDNCGNDLKLLTTWIEEIAPNFPTLDIKIIKSDCTVIKDHIIPSYQNFLTLNNMDKNGQLICMELDLSKRSTYYGYTNIHNFKSSNFTNFYQIYQYLFDYLINNSIKIDKDTYISTINSFCLKHFKDIQRIIKSDNTSTTMIPSKNSRGRVGIFDIVSGIAIDANSLTVEKIIAFLSEIVDANLTVVSNYINTRIGLNNGKEVEGLYIQALYHKKAYMIEAYLAHHLIRAGLSSEFTDFIKQYFLIKSKLPNEYFWNLIFINMFGFNIYYYYWLTNQRTFKLTTPEIFNKKAQEYKDVSSLQFFRNFFMDFNKNTLNNLIELYKVGRFEEFRLEMSHLTKVEVKESSRNRLKSLRLFQNYEIIDQTETQYTLRADDYRLHNYLKKNFNTIKVAI
jgi:hypothetical protein